MTELISGFSMLVSESKALPQKGNRAREIAPRTALGLDARGVLIVLEVDGCEKCPASVGGPQGLTLAELADEMVKLGAVYALNLDGGGSSTTVVHDGCTRRGLANLKRRPLAPPLGARRVHRRLHQGPDSLVHMNKLNVVRSIDVLLPLDTGGHLPPHPPPPPPVGPGRPPPPPPPPPPLLRP